MNLPTISFTVIYNSRDITRDITGQVVNIQYTDKVTGESDSLELSVEDTDQRWQNTWYPAKGDTIELILRDNGQQLNCGTFEIDELALSSSRDGDIMVIRALAAGIKKQLRTKRSYAHEDKSLREIANTVAANLGLSITGQVPDIRLHRIHQYRETDLSFLNRVGSEYGCIFSVRGTQLVFIHYVDLEGRAAAFSLTKKDFISLDLRDTTHKTFKSVKVKHHDPYKKQTVSYFFKDDDDTDGDSSDELELRTRVENPQQAEAKGKHALFKGNTEGVGGDVILPGHLLFVSGNNFSLTGIGQMSGTFHILEATHTVNREGAYQVAGNIKRVQKI